MTIISNRAESIGFTGTRKGMTRLQLQTIEAVIDTLRPKEVHHGDCIGSDTQFHTIALRRKIRIVVHPPDNDALRAHVDGGIDVYPKPYQQRNLDIVTMSDLVIAAPDGKERDRSGTWMTVRMAHARKKEVMIVYPEGNIEMRK
jgi:hypothetical protein